MSQPFATDEVREAPAAASAPRAKASTTHDSSAVAARPSVPPLRHRMVAEALGTSALVFAGCGAIVSNAMTAGAVTHVGIALSFGLVVTIVIAAIGHLSGAHINPAVTLAFAVFRRFPWRDVPVYVGAQLVGATIAAVALATLFAPVAHLGATMPAVPPGAALVVEALLTGMLMFVILAVATDTRAVGELAAISIGATVALAALFAGPVTGASMNPARSLGPAAVAAIAGPDAEALASLWLYLAGPTVGAVIGAAAYQFVRHTPSDPSPKPMTRPTP